MFTFDPLGVLTLEARRNEQMNVCGQVADNYFPAKPATTAGARWHHRAVYQMTDLHAAGVNAGKWLRVWGYPGATITPARSPGGVYVTAEHALALVAFDGHQAGKPALQSLVRASNRSPDISLMAFASNGYSVSALTYALKMGIALFAFAPFGDVFAVNDRARTVLGGTTEAHWSAVDGSA